MYLEKKQDQSIYYWLKSIVSDQVTVVDAFPTSDLRIPSVSIEAERIQAFQLELGTKKQEQIRTWIINIFGMNKAQRDDLGYLIFNALDEGIPVNNYDEGFPPSVTPSLMGRLELDTKDLVVIQVFPELVEQLYYRSEITFTTYYRNFTEV
jgi:hypothetical protein